MLPSFVGALLLAGCAVDPCAGTRDLLYSPGGLELTEQEHGVGWGQDQCFQCHQSWKIHRHACLDLDGLDVAAVAGRADPRDTTTCVPCHGANGVAGWEDLERGSDTGSDR